MKHVFYIICMYIEEHITHVLFCILCTNKTHNILILDIGTSIFSMSSVMADGTTRI